MSTIPQVSPAAGPQRPYLAIEQPPADEAEAQRLAQLRAFIDQAGEVRDVRDFAGLVRELLGPGYQVQSGGSHTWIRREEQPERLAVIADRNTSNYRDWNVPAPAAPTAAPDEL